jgi:hypothetical protein
MTRLLAQGDLYARCFPAEVVQDARYQGGGYRVHERQADRAGVRVEQLCQVPE